MSAVTNAMIFLVHVCRLVFLTKYVYWNLICWYIVYDTYFIRVDDRDEIALSWFTVAERSDGM